MTTTQQHQQNKDMERQQREMLTARLREQVIHSLGMPAGLLKMQVVPLWENYYRVNVFLGEDITSAKVAHSYFVEAAGNGIIVESSPKITKKY